MLRIVVERSSDTALLRCIGRIVAGDEARALRDSVMCQADKRVVVLDLSEVDVADAAGLGVLVFTQTLASLVGFNLKVLNPSERVRELLAITGLDSVVEISYSEEPATHFNYDIAAASHN